MWNLGMANLAAVDRDQLIGIMKVYLLCAPLDIKDILTFADDCPGLGVICDFPLGHQDRSSIVLQNSGCTANKNADRL